MIIKSLVVDSIRFTGARWLISVIKRRIIVTYGADAVKQVQGRGAAAVVISVSHFSRGWSQEEALALGVKIKNELSIVE